MLPGTEKKKGHMENKSWKVHWDSLIGKTSDFTI
jgi:hypothetical protein